MVIVPAVLMAASCVEASTFKLPVINNDDMPPIVSFVMDRCKVVARSPKRVVSSLKKSGFSDAEYFGKSKSYFKQTSSQITFFSTSVAPDGVKESDAQLMANKYGYPMQSFFFIDEGLPKKDGKSCGAILNIGMSEVMDNISDDAIIGGLFSRIKTGFNVQDSLVLDENLTKPNNHYFVWRQKENSNITVSIERLAPVMALTFSKEEKK